MMFLTKLMLLTASQTDADLSTVLEETKAVAEEVHEDLQNLKPNVILDTLKSWLPGLMSFGYRLAIAILILVIGNRIVHVVRRFLQKTFERMNMDPSVSRFLILLRTPAFTRWLFSLLQISLEFRRPLSSRCLVRQDWLWACPCRAVWQMWQRHPAHAAAAVWCP